MILSSFAGPQHSQISLHCSVKVSCVAQALLIHRVRLRHLCVVERLWKNFQARPGKDNQFVQSSWGRASHPRGSQGKTWAIGWGHVQLKWMPECANMNLSLACRLLRNQNDCPTCLKNSVCLRKDCFIHSCIRFTRHHSRPQWTWE